MSKLGAILNAIVGLGLIGFGGAFLYLEMKSPPTHTTHIVLFTTIAFVGALLTRPDPLFAVLKQFVVIVGPYVPVIGGRRSGDPPAPPGGSP